MPRKTISFELDFITKDIFPRFTVKQFDDVSFNIKPKNQGLDYDTTGMTGKIFVGVDNDMFMQTTGITVSSNNINVILDKNMLQNRGRAYAEIELTDNNGTITSSSFIFNIDEKIGEGAKIPEGYEGFVAKYERLISQFKSQVNSTIDNCNTNINSTINNCNKAVDNKLNDVDNFVDNKILDIERRFNTLTSSRQQESEVIDARDGEVSLKARLDRDLAKGKIIEEQTEGNFITVNDSIGGYIHNVEVLGNTVQDLSNLADIKSVGELQEDGTYKMSILSCGKNLFDISKVTLGYFNSGTPTSYTKGFYGWVRVKPNTNYKIYFKSNSTSFRPMVYEFAKDKTSVTKHHYNGTTFETDATYTITTTNSTSWISISQLDVDNSNLDKWQIQIEEGTQSTPYEPYQGNKCDILLPCQLEKVGDVSDRLYYDDVEKAWCIEKNVGEVAFDGSSDESWASGGSGTTTTGRFYITSPHAYADGIALSSRFVYKNGYGLDNNNSIYVSSSGYITFYKTLDSIVTTTKDTSGFKTWLSQNPTLVKYQLATPQKIVLPLSTQIALNSFFGTTHVYMESGEVEGTIKCKIPKSLGATVQSLNNKTDILSDRIEAIEGLKDSQNMKYETDKGYLVCKETKNGVIDDLKLEGRTLVNLLGSKSKVLQNASTVYSLNHNITYTPNNIYTIIFYSDATSSNVFLQEQTYSAIWLTNIKVGVTKGLNIIKFTSTSNTTVSSIRFSTDASFSGTVNITDLILLEGDHTQNPPSYFEGLKSVGDNTDEIVVSSVNENLCEFIEVGGTIGVQGDSFGNNFSNKSYFRSNYINVSLLDKISYTFSHNDKTLYNPLWCFYDSNKKGIYPYKHGTTTVVPSSAKYVRFEGQLKDVTDITPYINDIEFAVYKGDTLKSYTPHQSDKKQILFYNSNGELEPVTELHEWDSIEKHSDNKWYYHKRSEKVVLNGSEDSRFNATYQNTLRFSFTDIFRGIKFIDTITSIKMISNSFKNIAANVSSISDIEGISVHSSSVTCINILKSKLSTQDVTGFKQWLSENNVTVVYQLAEEEVYELAPLHLDSYANETLILCNSGAISPRMEFSITSHISELVKAYGERINLLEEKVYKYMVAQNRLQLASTYSADSVTFKVDYALCSEGEEEYNNDLYDLILNNILVGKDNYDYDKMFNIILDYASWNQISWEQFDILVGLMDMQHNPPVEDIIEEDIIEEETPVE